MAEFERTEEETIQAIKDWWKENGRAVIAGIVLGIGGIVGVRYWFSYQHNLQQKASLIFGQVEQAIQSNQVEQADTKSGVLLQQYGSTTYASLGALAMAKLKLEGQQPEQAEHYLRWVLDNSSEEEYQHLARQRLARLLLAEQKPGQAEALLKDIDEGTYSSIYAEIRGDIFAALGKVAEARNSYQTALADAGNPLRHQLLQMKLNDLAVVAPKSGNEVKP
jgi:predicted negative regulator of RcsB-dependent stress response